jgi:hypothetical protein
MSHRNGRANVRAQKFMISSPRSTCPWVAKSLVAAVREFRTDGRRIRHAIGAIASALLTQSDRELHLFVAHPEIGLAGDWRAIAEQVYVIVLRANHFGFFLGSGLADSVSSRSRADRECSGRPRVLEPIELRALITRARPCRLDHLHHPYQPIHLVGLRRSLVRFINQRGAIRLLLADLAN